MRNYTDVKEGQEWEKQDSTRMGSTRIRVLSTPGTRRRVKVGTVTYDGRVIREREILVSALSNTGSGYRLLKDAPAPAVERHDPPEYDGTRARELWCKGLEHSPAIAPEIAPEKGQVWKLVSTGREWRIRRIDGVRVHLRAAIGGQRDVVRRTELLALFRLVPNPALGSLLRDDETPPARQVSARSAAMKHPAPAHPAPLAIIRAALERGRLAAFNAPARAEWADALAALAPLERALPDLMDAYHYGMAHERGPDGWRGCSRCVALLEGRS